jgi:two-component system cell cycle response regulator DivK
MSIAPEHARVVIIEDNPDNLFILQDLLEAEVGVSECSGLASGRQFFEWLARQPNPQVDLILLDLQMPRENGYAVLAQIQQTPALAGTKVVAVTANVMSQDVERTRAAGFVGFIGKPINAERFPLQIKRLLADEEVWEPR